MISIIGFFGLAFIMIAAMKRVLVKPIQQATEMMEEMSKGHLHSRIEVNAKDEIGMMAERMNNFSDMLQSFVALMYEVANGKLDIKATTVDSKDELAPALNKIIDTLGH